MKVTMKGILHFTQWSWENVPSYRIYDVDMTNRSDENVTYAPIKEVSIDFEIPDDFDPRPAVIAGLRDQKQKILADAQVAANKVEERIQQLLCLENKVES